MPLVDRPGKLGDLRRSRDDGASDAHSGGRRPVALVREEPVENLLERNKLRARVDARPQNGKGVGADADDRDGGLRPAHVGREHSHGARQYPSGSAQRSKAVSESHARGMRTREKIKKTPGRGGAARGAKGGGEVFEDLAMG